MSVLIVYFLALYEWVKCAFRYSHSLCNSRVEAWFELFLADRLHTLYLSSIHEVYLMTFTRGGLGGKICQNQSAYTVEESVQVGQNNTGIPSLFH